MPFIFVPHGDPEPTAWMAQHPDWIKIPATFVPRGGRRRPSILDAAPGFRPGEGGMADGLGLGRAEYLDTDAAVRAFRAADAVMSNPALVLAGATPPAPPTTDNPPPAPIDGPDDMARKEAVARLTAAAREAYEKYSRDCSHAVWVVLRRMVDASEDYRTANALMAYVQSPGSGWRQVTTLEEASELANEGKVVIGGLASTNGSGHVLLVLPGDMKPAGGFNGIKPSPETYPRAMSGSSSGYAGAMSQGERTVRDAWTEKDWKNVTFWVHE